MAVRAFRFWLVNYRRTWRGSIYSSVANPVLYLGAMGLGLGTLVDQHGTASLGGVSYLAFLAPGLLAAAAMQTAMGESTYPVLASVKWLKTYQAAAASPLRPADLFHGHLLFTAMRLAMNAAIFLVVMAAFGAVQSAWAVAALPVCVLTGLAFAAPIEACAITRDKDTSFAVIYPVRADPAVPVLRHVLPGHPASGLDPAGGLRHAAVARRGPVPGAQPGHRRRGRRAGATSAYLVALAGRSACWSAQRTYRRRLVCARRRALTRAVAAAAGPAAGPLLATRGPAPSAAGAAPT